MIGDQIVSVIAVLAALVLVASGIRARGIPAFEGLKMALLWAFLFLAVALLATVMTL